MLSKILKTLPLVMAIAMLFPAAAYGFEIPQIIRVGLETGYSNAERVDISNREISLGFGTDAGRGQHSVLTASSGFNVRVSDGRAVLFDGSNAVVTLDPNDNIAGVGEPINLGERQYRGAIEFMVAGSRITAVNCLTIEEYLYSVVPSEMPSTWHIEALKAQAVASRSYAMTRIRAHAAQGYHLCDRTHCQVYIGVGRETESTTAAVNATMGVMAYFDGLPINAVYSSSNGGSSENSEDVWNEAVPYLRAVNDIYETSGRRWERTYTLRQIQALNDTDIGTVTRVYIARTSPLGRVQELVIEGTGGTRTLTKEAVRTFFSGSEDGMLESKNFVMQGAGAVSAETRLFVTDAVGIEQFPLTDMFALSVDGELARLSSATVVGAWGARAVYEPTSAVVSGGSSQGNLAVFTGRGWGHGVGMSQHGARDMAEAGFNFVQILRYYYTGIEVG
ncbi:MAG: SpoIID/LytB domain-containing protein [Defluviitaleaceae bacterium]|nr:SpoIID/LytB domain-containing protein [Defluviitaleaceae bacterium]